MNARDDLDNLRRAETRTPVPHPSPTRSEEAGQASPSSVSMPSGPVASGHAVATAAQLEMFATRDRMIQAELLRLQRTLSRQNFRGAESARRLVRKLARKAELNIAELESLLRLLG